MKRRKELNAVASKIVQNIFIKQKNGVIYRI